MTDSERGERLQKILARAGLGSRRLMETWIEEGKVTVNGRVARLGDRADLNRDAVKVDGRRITPPPSQHKYVLLNKPTHHVCTLSDPEGRPTIMDLVPERLHSGLVPVGRLDYDSEGLILLTDDGELAHRVAHPRYGCHKTYEVKVKGRPSRETLAKLEEGMLLYGKPTAPVTVAPHRLNKPSRESQSNSWWRVVLSEGRTRQIREMFFRLGHPVSRLRRVGIAHIRDPHLTVGSWRMLTEQEVEELRQRTAKVVAPKKAGKPSRRASGRGGVGRSAAGEGPQRRRSGAAPSTKGRRRPQGAGADSKPTRDRPSGRGGEGGGAAPGGRRGPGRPSPQGPGRRGSDGASGGRPGGRGSGKPSGGQRGPGKPSGGQRGPGKPSGGQRGPGKPSGGQRGPGQRGPKKGGPGGRGGGKR